MYLTSAKCQTAVRVIFADGRRFFFLRENALYEPGFVVRMTSRRRFMKYL